MVCLNYKVFYLSNSMLLRHIFCCYICYVFPIRYSNAGAGAGYTFYPLSLFIRRNLPKEITVMIINTGQMCTVNYSGRNVRFKVPRLDKKCVVDIVYYKNKTSENIRRIKRQLFFVSHSNVSPFP